MGCLAQRKGFLDKSAEDLPASADHWWKYRVLLEKPGTGKSQVVIRGIYHAIQQEYKVLLAAPVALLAQGYRSIFGPDLDTDTIHAAFRIPVDQQQAADVNYALNRFDMVVIDKASLVSPTNFSLVASTLNRLNARPVVIVAGDQCQQQPLQTVQGRVSNTVSFLNDQTFQQENSVKHVLYQQFRILDAEYARFVDFLRYNQPTQVQVDEFQADVVLCPRGDLLDDQIYSACNHCQETSIMTVSHATAQRVNQIMVSRDFFNQPPLSTVPPLSQRPTHPALSWYENCDNRKQGQDLSHSKWSRRGAGVKA